MKYEYLEKVDIQGKRDSGVLETVCGMVVQLVFADKKNSEVPEIVGSILKGSYLQHQSV